MNPFLFLLGLTGLLFAMKKFNKTAEEVTNEIRNDDISTPIPDKIEPNLPVRNFEGFNALDSVYITVGGNQGVEPALVKAIAIIESSENPDAINPSDPSYGLMQVLCASDGPNSLCKNRLPAIPMFATMTPEKLLNPIENVTIGAQILAWNINKFGFLKGIAAYNSASAQKSNVPENGPFPNQGYVDKVLREYTALKNSGFGSEIL